VPIAKHKGETNTLKFELSRKEMRLFTGELAYSRDLIEAFQDTGAYENNSLIASATHRIKTGLIDLQSGLEKETVGPEPGKSLISDTIMKGRARHEY
jgi:hypothetical protein